MSMATSAAVQSTPRKNGPSSLECTTSGGNGLEDLGVLAGTDSVGEGGDFFLPLGLIRLPLAMIYAASKSGRIGKVKRFVDGILFRKQVFLGEFKLSKNSHLGQIAIGFLSEHHRSPPKKPIKAVTSAKAWT